MDTRDDRRRFLLGAAALGASAALSPATALARPATKPKKGEGEEEEVSPTEDLMREHGVLRRILLVYKEAIHRLDGGGEITADPIARSATIVRAFIEDYHERDEEEHIFPRFRKAKQQVDLVETLLAQHKAGRALTANVLRLATPAKLGASKRELSETMKSFIRMYEPHAAREDTVLFPAFAKLVSEKEMRELQEIFEQKEKALPMGDFEKMVSDVEGIERSLGIYDLAQFTPKT